MAKTIFDIINEMPRNLFRRLKKELKESDDYYLIIDDPKHVPSVEKARARAKFVKFGIPERMVNTDYGLENAAWAVHGRSTGVR